MSETYQFALLVLLASAAGLAAVLANRLTERIRVPAPLLMLAAAAVAAAAIPDLHSPSERTVEHVVTLALVLILFDGGLHIGWTRFRAAAAPIIVVGVAGTFLTAAAAAALLHLAFGLSWYLSLLVATAVAPTDPAVVFSVLGKREITGRAGTILEGESGANDPVGIALMTALLAAGGLSAGTFSHVAGEFVVQMVAGATIGAAGGWCLLWFMRHIALPSEGLYPLRSAPCAFALFGAATLAHGSGFLAVLVAGILIGDAHAPYKREIERFHSALASLGEIVAFVVLGLTVDLHVLTRANVLIPGLVLGAVLAVAVRPLLVGMCLVPARLQRNEFSFVVFAGLKGAVPILLGELLRAAHVPQAERLYGIVVVVVVFSVLVQGGLVPAVSDWLQLPMSTLEPEPWALGVRLRDEPDGVHRFQAESGSPADGVTVERLGEMVAGVWVSMVVRDARLLPIGLGTTLQSGDDVTMIADADKRAALGTVFASRTART